MINLCTGRDLGKEPSVLQHVTLTFDVYQVCHGVGRCVKGGSCFMKLGVKINGQQDIQMFGYRTIYCGHDRPSQLLLSFCLNSYSRCYMTP